MGRIAVIGAGSFGTAMACAARRAGQEVVLWAREAEVAEAINAGRGNPVFLPDIPVESGIAATTDLAAAVRDAEAVLLAVPSQFLRAVAGAAFLPSLQPTDYQRGNGVRYKGKILKTFALALSLSKPEGKPASSPAACEHQARVH